MKKMAAGFLCITAALCTAAIFTVPVLARVPGDAGCRMMRDHLELTLAKGEAVRLFVPGGGKKVIWGSPSKHIAEINKNGCLKAKSPGTAVIFAETGKRKYICTVKVQARLGQNSYLDHISDISAGTVLPASKINFASEKQYFTSEKINSHVYERIGGKSFDPNGIVKKEDLRYLKVLHYNFDHKIQVGEMIVNKSLAEDVCAIFQKLFEEEYEIQSMHLIDDYWTGDGNSTDEISCSQNNTSSFCYRPMTGSGHLSYHSYGRAIDINPVQNPYVVFRNGEPYCPQKNARKYVKRSSRRKHMITHDDDCYKVFREYGFSWGGDWRSLKDYQHFERR